MACSVLRLLLLLPLWLRPDSLVAGGSGLNVVVVANGASSNSCDLANYYCLKRQIPREQVLRILWQGSNVEWTQTDFTNSLLNPLLAFLSTNGLTNQIQYVVLSMDIPYRITGSRANSTTAALFYGYKPGTKDLTNSYAASEARFGEAKPANAPGYSFLAMMLTAGSLAQAKHLVDQGLASDGTFPGSPAWLAKSSDPIRNIRYRAFDNAVFNTRLSPEYSLARTNLDSPWGLTNLLGFQTGLANFGISSNAFRPGAIADSLTSFAGQIFEAPGQTTLLSFIHAGAAASYGTITEPQPIVKKFPDPQVYFYQSRGYSIAESYYQAIEIPLEGLLVGEPLAAPFRTQLFGGWAGLKDGMPLSATTNLTVSFAAPTRSIEAIDLFLDGRLLRNLTNFLPQAGNRLAVRLNGYEIPYTVPTNATRRSIAFEFAGVLNNSVHTNITKVAASAHGDRIELQYLATLPAPGTFEFVDHDATTNSTRTYLAVPDRPWTAPWIVGRGWTGNGSYRVAFGSTVETPGTVYASPDLVQWQPVFTNSAGGVAEFLDAQAALFPQRFYRLAIPALLQPPRLMLLDRNASGEFRVSVASLDGRPYFLQASSDLRVWSDIYTNQSGDGLLFGDPQSAVNTARFYRTRSARSSDYSAVSVVGQIPTGGRILQVQESRAGDSVIWASTNAVDWFPIFRHAGQSVMQTEVASETGSADFRVTTLQAAQTEFLTTVAYGLRKFSINTNGPLQASDYLGLTVTRTNGSTTTVSVTNQSTLSSLKAFVQVFVNALNNRPELMASDGLVAEDLVDSNFGWVDLNLRARSRGREAAAIQVTLNTSSNLNLYSAGTHTLDENVRDLRPRNHLFITTGVPAVNLTFPFDTTQLADGYHELTVVAYEGTSVHTQTKRSVTVVVSNTALYAEISAPTNSLSVADGFSVTVVANTNSVGAILLYTTGGFLMGATNQPSVTFPINGHFLGAGEHPFYALVTTTNGFRYRTGARIVTLTRP